MATLSNRSEAPGEPMDTSEPIDASNVSVDVQSYLIANYKDALKRGDKSAAKACLLAARYSSVNDPVVTNEIYIMAKSDGDVCEASKCFSNIFHELFSSQQRQTKASSPQPAESLTVMNQMREELRLMINEIKAHTLKLRATNAPAGTNPMARQMSSSVSQSPLLSPRLRMSSEDRAANRESVIRLDSHLYSTTRGFFYLQLFDNLSEDIRREILSYSIEACDNPFERCRLMMLAIVLFKDSASNYGANLLRTLMDLSESTDKSETTKITTAVRPVAMCHYAKNLLVLDATPVVIGAIKLSDLDIGINNIIDRVINHYSECCLDELATEHSFADLHDGVKRTIAARILGKDNNLVPDDVLEENLITTLNLLSERFPELLPSDAPSIEALQRLRQMIFAEGNNREVMTVIKKLLDEMILDGEISDEYLFSSFNKTSKEPSSQGSTSSTPPKSRGRPKKAQPAATDATTTDDGNRRQMQNKARELQYLYFLILDHMFINAASYLRQTRSRILMPFSNPLASSIGADTSRTSSRSKKSSGETGSNAAKKIKVESPIAKPHRDTNKSPLNSEPNRKLDMLIRDSLLAVRDSLNILDTHPNLSRLWDRFKSAYNIDHHHWYRRVTVDMMLVSDEYEKAAAELKKILTEKGEGPHVKEEYDEDVSMVTIMNSASSFSPAQLRAATQLVSCHAQSTNKSEFFRSIDDLVLTIKQSGLLTIDESYSNGNTTTDYRTTLADGCETRRLGFLFFDAPSIVRYVVELIMDILRRHTKLLNTTSDSVVGHIFVLSQFDWPREYMLYDQCLTWLRDNKPTSTTPQCLSASTKFTYPEFFQYIYNPCVIEDFMALLNQGYTLDIKGSQTTGPISSQRSSGSLGSRSSSSSLATRSGKAITTRGVNKTFKEDLKVALVAQMRLSLDSMPLELVCEFIQATLVPYFLN